MGGMRTLLLLLLLLVCGMVSVGGAPAGFMEVSSWSEICGKSCSSPGVNCVHASWGGDVGRCAAYCRDRGLACNGFQANAFDGVCAWFTYTPKVTTSHPCHNGRTTYARSPFGPVQGWSEMYGKGCGSPGVHCEQQEHWQGNVAKCAAHCAGLGSQCQGFQTGMSGFHGWCVWFDYVPRALHERTSLTAPVTTYFRGSVYRITSKHSGMVLSVWHGSGGWIEQRPWVGGAHQKWVLMPMEDGWFSLRSVWNRECMDIPSYSRSSGQQYYTHSCHGEWNQLWKARNRGGEWYEIYSPNTKVVDIRGRSTSPGGQIHQWSWHGGDNQLWKFTLEP